MEDKKIPMRVLLIIIFLLACVGLYSITSGLFNNGRTADGIGTTLERAGREQREAEKSIDNVGTRLQNGIDSIERITERNQEAAERINASVDRQREGQKVIADSERRIADCLRICQEIRSCQKKD